MALAHLEIAARYLWTNLLPLPLVIAGLSVMLLQWWEAPRIILWAVASVATWSFTLTTLYLFLRDPNRGQRVTHWSVAICATLFVSSVAFAGVAPAFWIPGDRLNNVLLYVVLGAGIASSGAQSAPSTPVVVTNVAPYAIFFIGITLANEAYPAGLLMAFLQVCYVGLVAMYARAVWQLARDMLVLREDKEELIAKLRHAVEDANLARDRAERASAAKSEFLANMSHELRTPLNAVLGFSEVIKDQLFGREAVDRYVDYASNVHASGSHLLGLINDILDLSKIEAGKWQLRDTELSLRDQCRDMLRLIEPQAAQKALHLGIDAPRDIVLRGDERAIRQMLINLVGNAVKFTPRDGTITVALRSLPDGSAQVTVTDTGIGIAPEDLDRVLESFGQGRHDIATAEERGTGLGLPIVKGLARAHGGDLSIDSKIGKGTTVSICFPSVRVISCPPAALVAAS